MLMVMNQEVAATRVIRRSGAGMSGFVAVKRWPTTISNFNGKVPRTLNGYKLQPSCRIVAPSHGTTSYRRRILIAAVPMVSIITFDSGIKSLQVWAEEESNDQTDKDESVIGAIKSLFDPDEKTKSGKVLPKAYLKTAREVVKTLRESLREDPKDNAKFRRTADAAKESIREYLSSWRGEQKVVNEESYIELEKAIRSLASFYSKAGPSAPLPETVKSEILNDLDTAEEYL